MLVWIRIWFLIIPTAELYSIVPCVAITSSVYLLAAKGSMHNQNDERIAHPELFYFGVRESPSSICDATKINQVTKAGTITVLYYSKLTVKYFRLTVYFIMMVQVRNKKCSKPAQYYNNTEEEIFKFVCDNRIGRPLHMHACINAYQSK